MQEGAQRSKLMLGTLSWLGKSEFWPQAYVRDFYGAEG